MLCDTGQDLDSSDGCFCRLLGLFKIKACAQWGRTCTTLTDARSGIHALSSPCSCEIRLRGFPVQTTPVPLVSSPESIPDPRSIASSFYLEESDLKALLTPGCFYAPHACLEIVVFTGRKWSHCGVGIKKQQIGMFKLAVGPEWGEGRPVILFNGWIGIGKSKLESGKPGAELHLRVKLDPDPRYVFQFEDETKLSPQIVQLQGTIKQPIFSCKFSQDRVSQVDPLNAYWSADSPDQAWDPGLDLLICCRFHLLSEFPEGGEFLMSEIFLNSEKGGEFFIDVDRQVRAAAATPVPSPQSSGDFAALSPVIGGFVMSCRVQGEGKKSKPLVQLAMRHVTCVEDAAIFMALAAAVDLSIEACRPFRRKTRRGTNHSW
ncbi:nuclear factor 1 A-type protein [Actinidia rufa]|uniref:Nuclear factor 1 A-type protein n=1 Tax=Actinidia rufa TaxID=165716 RepID=A0A7J0EWS7_9ERIC|nr:nuclear factor 1 A-type protein [Actinidia rufa]